MILLKQHCQNYSISIRILDFHILFIANCLIERKNELLKREFVNNVFLIQANIEKNT